MQVFIYIDNFKKMIKQVGHVWQSMASELLHEPGRRMKTIDHADQTGTVELMKPMIDKESGERYLANDLSRAKFDVIPDVGPSSVSRKAALVRELTGILQMTQDPDTMTVLTSMILMNLEGEGMSDIRSYYRGKLVRMGVIQPTDDEKQQLMAEQQQAANQPPDAQSQFLLESAKKAAADAQKSQAQTELTVAQTEKTRADAMVAIAGIGQAQQAHTLDVVQHLDGQQMAQAQLAHEVQQAAQAAAQQAAAQPPQGGEQ
jgi:hypothetical protein